MPAVAALAQAGVPQRATHIITRVLENAARRYARHQAYTQTLNELRALSDRDLADLGMHRSGLKAVAQDAARKTA
jgi:uncharacterized protein YjiS (DUF1127 family)